MGRCDCRATRPLAPTLSAPIGDGLFWGHGGRQGRGGGGCDPPQWSQNCGTEGAKHYKDAGTTLKLGGGEGKRLPGSKVIPTQN